MKTLLSRVALLVRSRTPIIQLVTHEEERVERALEKVAQGEGLAFYRWRSTTGLIAPDGSGIQGTLTAEAALAAIGEPKEPALFLFSDLQPHLQDPAAARRLRDHATNLVRRGQALILLDPVAGLPEGVAKDSVTLDVPLPDRSEVARLLAALVKAQGMTVPPDRIQRFVEGALGLSEREIKRLYARILLGGGGFCEADLAELVEEKRQAIRRTRFLELWDQGTHPNDVGGMDALKRWLAQRALSFTADARAYGLPEPRGLFMLGVQGCGKSLMAKAVAGMWQIPLLRLDLSAVARGSGGEEHSLRQAVRVAESLAPVVLWIDEIEKGFAMSEGTGEGLGTFLTWTQEKTRPVFVVATANEVRDLPPELLRKGRFDEIFFVDLPDVHERLEILEIHLRRRARDPDRFDLTAVSEETERFSGAELEAVVVSAMFQAFADKREVDEDDLLDVARETIPLAVTMDDRLKDLREWARPRARRASHDRRRVDFFEDWVGDEGGVG